MQEGMQEVGIESGDTKYHKAVTENSAMEEPSTSHFSKLEWSCVQLGWLTRRGKKCKLRGAESR